RFAPNHSYINIYDYKTVKELADYLNYLSNNETAYNESIRICAINCRTIDWRPL
ncbi:unnamed protein product, partial [Rotaria socialis]